MKRLYNVQLIINVPVWASSAGKAKELAVADRALYDEGNQLAQGETQASVLGAEPVRTLEEAERIGWKATDMPWGFPDKNETTIGDLVK